MFIHTLYIQGVIDICTIDFQIHCPYRLQVSVHMSVAASSDTHHWHPTKPFDLQWGLIRFCCGLRHIDRKNSAACSIILPVKSANGSSEQSLSTSSMVAGVMQYNIFSSEQHEPCSTIVCGQPTLKRTIQPNYKFPGLEQHGCFLPKRAPHLPTGYMWYCSSAPFLPI